jgi:ABC-type ATPase with predicted acetyltransferase domain
MKIVIGDFIIRINKCKHKNRLFIKNLFGDNINKYSNNNHIVRSLWRCKDCGKLIRSSELNLEECYKVYNR